MAGKQGQGRGLLVVQVLILHSLVAIATSSLPSNVTRQEEVQKSCQLINPSDDSKLEFTSSPLTPVTVVIDRYFAINCSARNFCDIKWLKDFSLEFPFGDTPWIQLSDSKEELQLLRPNHDQKGNYTCIVTDGNVSINRTVEVFITDTPWIYKPISLPAKTCTNQTANIGQQIEFFCFFLNGKKIYDVNMTWEKQIETSPGIQEWKPVECLEQSIYEEKVDYTHIGEDSGYNEMPTAGKHLRIDVVDPEAFGYYRLVATSSFGNESTCVLSLSETPKANLTAIIVISVSSACLLLILVSGALTWQFKRKNILLYVMHHYRSLEEDGGKTYDAFICYADEDRHFALSLRQNLKDERYNVCVKDIDILAATTLVEELIEALKDSRRCILLISPDFLTAQHSALQVDVAIDQVMKKQLRIIPIIYRDVNAADLLAIPDLNRILTNIESITWDPNNEETSTEQLLRYMATRRWSDIDSMEERNAQEDL